MVQTHSAVSGTPELVLAGMPSTALTGAPAVGRFGLPVADHGLVPPVPRASSASPGYMHAPALRQPAGHADGSMLGRRAVALVAIAIGVGAVGMGVSYVLGRNQSLEPATYLRYALMLTLGVYVIVGGLLVTQLVPGIRLRWSSGSPATGVLIGAGVGGAISAVLLAIVSAASGHLAPDPRIVTLMSEGDVAHIAVTLGITCLCAPVIEEVLFRGLLLESLRGKGLGPALSMSGFAFAVWHLNPAALKYYALMGLLLGFLYVKRGLVCSMAAHFTFNGVLAVAALAVVLSPGKTFTFNDVSIHAPGGWSQHHGAVDGTSFTALALDGPSQSGVMLMDIPVSHPLSPTAIETAIRSGAMSSYLPATGTSLSNIREVQLAAGAGIEADFVIQGHSGNFVFVPRSSELVAVMFISAGSEKAKADFPHMLDSLRVA